ncbi:MAG TPA: hypothetical protein PK819_06280 [Thermomicrobiales bacterium]|nr:hypothetical protein [Thermomicrobiales bacterium]
MTEPEPEIPMLAPPIPRYDRVHEQTDFRPVVDPVPFVLFENALAQSSLSYGSRDLLRALLRSGRPKVFGGGGLGLDYAALFKTASRPDLLGRHITEVANHLNANGVDLLVVPGMSGYPIGAMYSQASRIPAVLLKKQTNEDPGLEVPPGSFLIPSYTGDTDTLISADMDAVQSIIDDIVIHQISAQANSETLSIEICIAGADEIIDKATMATAVTETAPIFVRTAVETALTRNVDRIAGRAVAVDIRVVAWVTPIIKTYNRSNDLLRERFGITPFAGLSLNALQLEPPAVGIEGLGVVSFYPRDGAQ